MDLVVFIRSYKIFLLGASALFGLFGCMPFLPYSDIAKSFRSDIVLVLALISLEEELKKKL